MASIIAVGRWITAYIVSNTRESYFNMINPTVGIPLRLLQVGHQVSALDIVENIWFLRLCHYFQHEHHPYGLLNPHKL